MRQRQQNASQAEVNRLSVKRGLQADCFAGVWGHSMQQQGVLESGDLEEALNAAMDTMEKLVQQLPAGFGLEWTAMSYQERLSGAQAPALYALSLLVVFLCLAALYESWSVPFSVMLVVPPGVIGALLATWMRGLENDVYFQVGLLTVIGLSAKNAILIVEFANEMNAKGHELMAATLHACRQRLRPILMTSLAFVFGVLSMATSTGAGSSSQHAVGTGVMGGMISATILAIYFVPLFFVLVRRRFPLKERAE